MSSKLSIVRITWCFFNHDASKSMTLPQRSRFWLVRCIRDSLRGTKMCWCLIRERKSVFPLVLFDQGQVQVWILYFFPRVLCLSVVCGVRFISVWCIWYALIACMDVLSLTSLCSVFVELHWNYQVEREWEETFRTL